MELTIYFVGEGMDEACRSFPFDSHGSAESYANDNPGTKVYSALAYVDFTTMEEV